MKVNLDMTLTMWEKVELPESKKDDQTGEWVKTGTKVEKTRYYLRDDFGEMLKFLADNEYREMEGSDVQVTLDITYNDYKNAVQTKLDNIVQLAS